VAARYSAPTVNWVRFAGSEDEVPDGRPVPEWPLETVLDAVAAAGFRHVGLDHYTVDAYTASGGRTRDLGELLLTRGLACSDVGILPIGTRGVLEAADSLAAIASATGAQRCIAAHYAPTPTVEAAAQLRACAEVLEEAGATLVLEFVVYGDLRTLAEATELCDTVGWERCRLLVDTWHFFRGDRPWALLRSLAGDQVGLLHVNDGRREPGRDALVEGRFGRLPVGAGAFPLVEFAAALDEIGYRGPVSTEVLSSELRRRPPGDAARVLMDSLRTSWPG
jgi:sugar phosphate isomerase/epimerase